MKFHPRLALAAVRQWAVPRLRRLWPVIPLLLILVALMFADFNDFIGYSPFGSNPCVLNTELDQSGFSALIYEYFSGMVLKPRTYSANCANDPTQCYPNVAIVTIGAKSEPAGLLTNTCDSRAFLARLIKDLDTLGPDVIMIDKYYTADSCGDADKNNQFVAALESTKARIVVGRATEGLEAPPDSVGCMALSDAFKFKYQTDPNPSAPTLPANSDANLDPNSGDFSKRCRVCYGLTRLNSDTLKVPLHWSVYKLPAVTGAIPAPPSAVNLPTWSPPAQSADDPNAGDGLAWAAAQRSTLLSAESRKEVAQYLNDQVQPYTTLVPIPYTSAMTALCAVEGNYYKIPQPAGTHDPCDNWLRGMPDNLDGNFLTLKGKIAVIGDLSDQDEHFSVLKVNEPGVYLPGGDQAGVFLQANYVQSILDHRFLRAVPTRVAFLFVLLFVICVYCLYWSHDVQGEPHLSPEQAVMGSLLALLVLIGICLAGLLKFHLFTPVWAIWGPVVFLVFRYLEASGHHRSQHLLGQLAGHRHPHIEEPVPTEPPPPNNPDSSTPSTDPPDPPDQPS